MQKEDQTAKEIRAHIEKVVVNVGIGRLSTQPHFEDKVLPELMKEVALFTGQKPRTNSAKRSIAGFKLREGAVVGISTTLRGRRMTEFVERLNRMVFPRIRDFRGLRTSSIDGHGNLTVGIKEHIVFPEVNPEDSKVSFGVEVTLVPRTRRTPPQAIQMYRHLGFPIQK